MERTIRQGASRPGHAGGTDAGRGLEDDVINGQRSQSHRYLDLAECQAHALTESGSTMGTRASLSKSPGHHSCHSAACSTRRAHAHVSFLSV